MKPLVVYHANCADGFGAAFAAWLKFGDEAEYLPMQYLKNTDDYEDFCGKLPANVQIAENDIYILDFSLPKAVMNELFAIANRVVWLDHHKTAFEVWCGEDYLTERRQVFTQSEHVYNEARNPVCCNIILDNNRSGALIAWNYFHPGKETPILFRHIDDYDRWQFKLDGTKAFNKALWSYAPWSFEQWNSQFFDDPADELGGLTIDGLRHEGEAILRAHDQNVQSVVKHARMECCITGDVAFLGEGEVCKSMHGLAANCPPHLTSDVGHELANQSGTFGLCWTLGRDGTAKCSLRSNGDYDVSAIAKAFGGGGHKNAAGFETDINTLISWLKC